MVRYDRGTDGENAKKIAMSNYNMKSEALNIEMKSQRARMFNFVNLNTCINKTAQSANSYSANEVNQLHNNLCRARMFLPVNTNTGICQNTQSTNAHSANKINQFHNYLFLLLHHINTKAVTINASVAPPPTKNNTIGGMSCRITPASNTPPIRSFATSSKNFAASVFMEQRYAIYPNNTNFFQTIGNEKN
jgi:hypothetical protein